jgi:hypothetical protein
MNTLLEARSRKAETVGLCPDDPGAFQKANGGPPTQGDSERRWLRATVRTADSRRDDLQRTHWKKVWRSIDED